MDSFKEEKIQDVDSSLLICYLIDGLRLSAYPMHMYQLVNVFKKINYLHVAIGSIFAFY